MDYPFEVGSVYANHNGAYEVVGIDLVHNKMLIRYIDSGETFQADVAIQARIYSNILLDEQVKKEIATADATRFLRDYGSDFTGLRDSDFKLSTEGTTWRSRKSLPGRVARILSSGTPYTFTSWAIYGWPITFLTHRENYMMAAFELGSRKAKFTIEVDEINLYYGFYIERGNKEVDAEWDWPRLMAAIRSGATVRGAIMEAETEYKARFIGRHSGEGTRKEHFHFSDGLAMGAHSLWDEQHPAGIPVSERLARLDGIPSDHWGEVYILSTMPKNEAVSTSVRLAEQIAAFMRVLLPAYSAAVG